MLCAHCGAPIKRDRLSGGWLHANPLEDFVLSRREADDIHRDPPRPKQVLHRQTVIHPATPGKRG